MSTPDEAVAAQVAEQAAAVAPPSDIPNADLSAATPAAADIEALRKQLADAEAAQSAAADAQAAQDAAEQSAGEPTAPSASSEIQAALRNIHDRLVAIEQHLGL